jgi:hypothetical protein
MFNTIITDDIPKDYTDYGTPPYVPYKIKDVSIGPKDLNDSSEGLNFKYWVAYAEELTNDLFIEDLEEATKTFILNEPDGIASVSLSFDQSANDSYAYITGTGDLKIRFFDQTLPGDVILNIGQAQSATFKIDMNYFPYNARSDILLFYIRSSAIYYRLQRDRYAIEYPTPITSGATEILDSGTTTGYRFQVRWR